MDYPRIKSSVSLWTSLVQKVRFLYGLPSYKKFGFFMDFPRTKVRFLYGLPSYKKFGFFMDFPSYKKFGFFMDFPRIKSSVSLWTALVQKVRILYGLTHIHRTRNKNLDIKVFVIIFFTFRCSNH